MFDFIKSIQERDPVKPTFAEVFLAYPGFHVMGTHKIAHFLWSKKLRALSRFIAHLGRILTGIEIHPGATIGKNLFIDHGMGVVIGETAVIGDNVWMYHGITLGGKGGAEASVKRHPTIEDGVIIGSGAQLLGNITVGAGAKVGACSIVTSNVPAGCTVVGNPARLVRCHSGDPGKAYGMPSELVDPVTEAINGLLADVKALKNKAGVVEEEPDGYQEHWNGSGI